MNYALWKAGGWGMALFLLIVLAGCQESSDRGEKSIPPALRLTPLSLDFGAERQQAQLSVENRGQGLLEWQASTDSSWLTLQPLEGQTASQETVTVRVDRSALTAATYEGSLAFRSNAGNEQIPVSVEVRPALKVDKESLDFGLEHDEIVFHVINTGKGILEWTLEPSSSVPWFRVSPSAGSTSVEETEVTASIDRERTLPGENTATLQAASTGGTLSIPVIALEPSETLYLGPGGELTDTPFSKQALWSKRLTGLPAEWTYGFGGDVTIHQVRTHIAISAQEPTGITLTAAVKRDDEQILSRGLNRIADSSDPLPLQDVLDFADTEAKAGDRLILTIRSEGDAWVFLGSQVNRDSHLTLE